MENTPLMMIRRTIGLLVLVFALLACAGCTQPAKTIEQVSVNTPVTSTSVPAFIPSPTVTAKAVVITTPVTLPSATVPTVQATSPVFPAGNLDPGSFVRYTGTEYSLDYPAAWSTNNTVLPLREYRHLPPECSVTFAYNLDQELRMYSSPDGSTVFYSGIVTTERDIWPRSGDQVVYIDIINSVLGYPEYCANLEGNEAFTIGGISQVPLDGVFYTGVRADFARINATGFMVGTGTAYVVTGKSHRGVFTFYSTSMDADTQASLSEYMFDHLKLDPGF
jgi:hypothetical protein